MPAEPIISFLGGSFGATTAKHASGEILVFVDADMVFDKSFLKRLVEPIKKEEIVGTFSKEEYVLNKKNVWSNCWNINKNLPIDKMHPDNYPDSQLVFRAIIKKVFEKSGGFKPIGYIDDYTISQSLGIKARVANGAIFYHRNPETLSEVFKQAIWIGKSEFKNRKVESEQLMRILSIIRYSLPLSLLNGISKGIIKGLPRYIIFKIVYDFGIEIGILSSFISANSYK